jgi:hypothetical protein
MLFFPLVCGALSIIMSVSGYQYPCIPVMGLGFISDPMHFLERLISSVDFCVENFVIVGSNKNEFIEKYSAQLHENLTYLPQPYSLIGVSEGWNLIFRTFPASPWYLITAYDVEFLPGQLEEFSRRFWKESSAAVDGRKEEIQTNFAHTKWQNLPGGKGFNLFALSQQVIENCGYFDENLFPAFWEDRDYQYRLSLWPGSRIRTYRTIRPWHGEHGGIPAVSSSSPEKRVFNYTSGTVYLGKEWTQVMKLSAEWNLRYVTGKWGCDLSSALQLHHLLNCTFTSPFNRTDAPIAEWTLNRQRIHKMRATFDRSKMATKSGLR